MTRRQYKTPRTAVSLIRNIDRVQHDNNKTGTPAIPTPPHVFTPKDGNKRKITMKSSQYTAHSVAQIDEISRIHAE